MKIIKDKSSFLNLNILKAMKMFKLTPINLINKKMFSINF